MTIWKYTEVDHSQAATQKLAKLFDGKKYFDYPKPVELLKRCIALYTDPEECIVLDFFSGSGTFAHAVMELNANDEGKRKYILVQAPEKMDNPANVTLTFDTIPQFAEERIRRAGQNVVSEINSKNEEIKEKNGGLFTDEANSSLLTIPDTGFRVLKLDSSNMEAVYYTPEDLDARHIFTSVDNDKSERTPHDELFEN